MRKQQRCSTRSTVAPGVIERIRLRSASCKHVRESPSLHDSLLLLRLLLDLRRLSLALHTDAVLVDERAAEVGRVEEEGDCAASRRLRLSARGKREQ